MIKITTHTIVKNEENWIWFALSAWKKYACEMFVVDDSSSDRTSEIIKSISDPKIKLIQKDIKNTTSYTDERNTMVQETKTDWFLILDGDEVWNDSTIKRFINYLEKLDKNTYGVVMHTRNCVGDVFHFQPEIAGKYEFLGRKGHLTIRAYRKLPGFHWQKGYPLEEYCDANGQAINHQNNHLVFFDGFYFHMTHLVRSPVNAQRKHGQLKKLESGIKIGSESELPEVFFKSRPKFVPNPLKKRPLTQTIIASVITPIKNIRRKINK